MLYLVDLGVLIRVPGVSAQDALGLAELETGRERIHRVAVYELAADGCEVIRVIPCQSEERKVSP